MQFVHASQRSVQQESGLVNSQKLLDPVVNASVMKPLLVFGLLLSVGWVGCKHHPEDRVMLRQARVAPAEERAFNALMRLKRSERRSDQEYWASEFVKRTHGGDVWVKGRSVRPHICPVDEIWKPVPWGRVDERKSVQYLVIHDLWNKPVLFEHFRIRVLSPKVTEALYGYEKRLGNPY
jgi:hypothetical protein